MMNKRQKEQARLACQISIGLMAGVFSFIPSVSAAPVQDMSATAPKQGHFSVDQKTTANVTAITSTDTDNIIPWKDFSVAQGEKVTFDGGAGKNVNNYMNVVTGQGTSQIAGAIEGGKDVYIVNPHGVMFAKGAEVNVGNLYVSTQDTTSAINAFKGGSTGAAVISAGTANAETGAATLDEGLATLIANNEALNTGAEALFAAVLDTANQKLAAAGLDAAGITLPELTAENYAAALDGALAQLNPDVLKEAASAQVEAVVRPQVEANADQVRSAVEAAAQQKVLEAVLQAAGQELTAEQYTQAVKAGMVSAEQAAMVNAAVEQQMASDKVKAQIEENVLAQIEQLVQQNVESYLASDETVAA